LSHRDCLGRTVDEAGAADGEAPLWALSTRRETAFDEAGDLMSGRRAVTSRGAAAGGPRARDALVARSRHCGWCARQLAASGEETGEIERVQGVHRQTMMCQRVCLLAPGGGGSAPFIQQSLPESPESVRGTPYRTRGCPLETFRFHDEQGLTLVRFVFHGLLETVPPPVRYRMCRLSLLAASYLGPEAADCNSGHLSRYKQHFSCLSWYISDSCHGTVSGCAHCPL